MRVFSRIGTAALCGLVLLAGLAQNASADTMYAQTSFSGNGYTANVAIYGNTPAGNFFTKMATTAAGVASAPTFQTFCVDLADFLETDVTPADVSITAANNVLDGNSVPRDIGKAGWVVNTYAQYGGGYNAANWSSLVTSTLDAVEQTTFNGLTGTQKDAMYGAVIQSAVWATAYGSNTTIVAGTQFAIANELLQAVIGLAAGKSSAVGFINYPPPTVGGSSDDNQDMLFAVPEPNSIAIAALGAIGFLGYGIRRRLKKD